MKYEENHEGWRSKGLRKKAFRKTERLRKTPCVKTSIGWLIDAVESRANG